MSNQSENPELDSVQKQRAKRLLRDLAEAPFVALVFDDDDVRVYSKGLDDESMGALESMLAEL